MVDILGLGEDFKVIVAKILKYSSWMGPLLIAISLLLLIADVLWWGGHLTLLLAFFLIVGGIWYKLPDMIGREIEAPDTSEEEI